MQNRGYCGYNCSICPAQSDDIKDREQLVSIWKNYFGHQNYTPENVRCDGCKEGGRIADKNCEARPCAIEKGFEFCMDCEDFPCDKVRKLMATKEGMILFPLPKTYDLSEDEYTHGMAQFASMPFILDYLIRNGKLKNWNN
ncbi:MAG: DUF3795 domain-containing protein [Candidatus Lokiarchaeota archaeon]|nr:DUF3795 domain-containing protein [Candidatus Lokiarchaeota archaeon]